MVLGCHTMSYQESFISPPYKLQVISHKAQNYEAHDVKRTEIHKCRETKFCIKYFNSMHMKIKCYSRNGM